MIEYIFIHTIVFFTIVTALFFFDRTLSIYSPLTWYLLFHFLVFVFKPILFYIGDYNFVFYYIGYFPSETDILETLFITDVGLIFFILGFYSYSKYNLTHFFEYDRTKLSTRHSKNSFLLMSLFILPLILYSLIKTGDGFSYDGSTGQLMEMINGISINLNTTGYITELKKMLTPYIFLLVVIFGFRKWVIAIIITYVLYRLYIGWERIHLVVLLLSLGLYYLMNKKKRWFPISSVVIVLLLLPLFSYVGENREFFKALLTGSDYVNDYARSYSSWLDQFDNLDFANFEYLTYIVSVVPNLSGTYSYWTQYLQVFTEPVPRIFWPDKPIGMPIKMIDLNSHGNFFGLTKSVIGDAWMNLGFFGVALNLFLLGFVLKRLFVRFFINATAHEKVAWLMILPFSIQLFRDGGIVTILKFLLFALLPFFVWLFIYKVNTDKLSYES